MPKLVFYSHDTFGLGHYRRSLKIADSLGAQLAPLEGVFLTGSAWSHLFTPPPGFRVVKLPPVRKLDSGTYACRDPEQSLIGTLVERRRLVVDTLSGFVPDLLIVDNVPCGLHGEVLPALRELRARGKTRLILALRDILDRSEAIAAEWRLAGAEEALVSLYDEIWVFGDEDDLRPLIAGGPLACAAEKAFACGRLGNLSGSTMNGTMEPTRSRKPQGSPSILVTGGGGGDAAPLVRAYLDALNIYEPQVNSRIILGPDFPAQDIAEIESTIRPSARLYRFVPDLPAVLLQADVVVAMAGYNTICEIRASGRPAVLVPRVAPRQEQLLRALKMQDCGRATMIHPKMLTPSTLWSAINQMLSSRPPVPEDQFGGQVAAERAAALLGIPTRGEPSYA